MLLHAAHEILMHYSGWANRGPMDPRLEFYCAARLSIKGTRPLFLNYRPMGPAMKADFRHRTTGATPRAPRSAIGQLNMALKAWH